MPLTGCFERNKAGAFHRSFGEKNTRSFEYWTPGIGTKDLKNLYKPPGLQPRFRSVSTQIFSVLHNAFLDFKVLMQGFDPRLYSQSLHQPVKLLFR